MARMKFPGSNKSRSLEKEKSLDMSGRTRKDTLIKKQKRSVIKPVLISLRRYREIFGDSDEEEEEFYGFRAEDLGLKAYRSFSVSRYLDGSERVSYRRNNHGARDTHSRHSAGHSSKLPPESSHHNNNIKETEKKQTITSPSQNIYAKQYKKRESYERRFARPVVREAVFDNTCLSPNVKSTTQVKANFVPRVPKPPQVVLSKSMKIYERNLFPFAGVKKKAAVPLAKQLLAKAKEGQRIRKQNSSVNKHSDQVRSRFGRVVKSKKLDYDDVTSPKFKAKREETRSEAANKINRGQKRPLEDGECPPEKSLRLAEVKLERMELPAGQSVYVPNPESPTGFDIRPLGASDGGKNGKFDFKDKTASNSSADENQTVTRKTRIKNAKRIKNALTERNHYQQAKFPGHKKQGGVNSRTSNSGDELSSSRFRKEGRQINSNRDLTSTKRSERIKIRKRTLDVSGIKQEHEKEDSEDQVSDASSISEVSSLGSNVSKKSTPNSTNKYVFKSKRLQEMQEKVENELIEDNSVVNLGEIKQQGGNENACIDSDGGMSSRASSRRSSQEEKRVHKDSDNECQPRKGPVVVKKRKTSGKKAAASRLHIIKNDNEIPSSSEDEESSKPLSEIKKEMEKSPEEQTERVVKRVIKVVKKVRTKSGETKTKVVKIIKKMGVRKKPTEKCAVVSGRRRVRCGVCEGCKIEEDCGVCRWCKDKPKFGGPGICKQSCVERKCLDPQPPKPLGSAVPRKSEKAKPKVAPKKEGIPMKKIFRKEQSQVSQSKKKSSVQVKPQPAGKRQAVLDDKNLVKLPWSDNSTEEEIWKEGFGICFTAGVPSAIKELCFLCGSKGTEKMYYCRVCAEPFHGFCLDETPIDESTWCCDNCSSCSVCGYQDKLLMCDRCQRGYHVECIGPHYPTEPEGEDDVWVCGRCVQCKNCGKRTAGEKPEALWMLEFTHCQDCGVQRQQGNFCPLCDKCYSDDDFESKMVHCVECDHWVHAECQGITLDQYECLSDLPEEVQFICRQCCSEQETLNWYKELMEEMEAGYERILEEIKSCEAYSLFQSHFEQLQVDNGHPKDLDSISAKVKEKKYITVESFCHDLRGILDKVFGLVEADLELTKQWSSLFSSFCKELALMFPWHTLKDNKETSENQPVLPPNGFIGPSICFDSWDHAYACVEDSERKSDPKPAIIIQSPPPESTSNCPEAKDNEEKMEIDNENIAEKTVKNEEPMELDGNSEEKRQSLIEEDTRRCLLCGLTRDAEPSGPGRLICCGLDEWVHVNCGLWSAEVFEDDEGRLQNVQAALSRGKQMKCEFCGEVGATVGCCEPRCPMNYHFMCARKAEAQFQDDKKVYCAQHSFRIKKKLLMENDDFCVERRVCVDMSKIRATKKFSRGFQPSSINLVQGSLTMENMGKLSEYSDTKQALYPINYRVSRLYWSVKDPTKRCRYYCTVEEKKVKTFAKKSHSEKEKELKDLQDLHKVISHEEIKKKEKATKHLPSSHGDVKEIVQPRVSNKSNDLLNSSYGKKLKKIAPHPGPSLINHTTFPGVLFNDASLVASNANSHLAKLRRILPAPQKPPALQISPANSPSKLLQHLAQQSKHIPRILSNAYARLPQKPPQKSSPTSTPTAHRTRKSPPVAKRTSSLDESIPQTVRQLNCDHEVVTKTADAEISNSPVKDKSSNAWLANLRDRASVSSVEELHVKFVITNDEGFRIEADTCEAAWKQVFDMVQEARIDRRLKLVPFAGVNGKAMFGVRQESIVSMLEQLPGAHQVKQYSFKYNPPFDISSLEGTAEQVLKENPHGCARAEVFNRSKKYDMFAFLASVHRVPPQLEEGSEEQENAEQTRDGLLTVKRPTCLDLPMAMRYRHLKQCQFNKDAVAVYRSPIHGRGLYCTRNISAGEMVIEYSGMLVRSVLTDKREKYYESKGIGCYMFRVDGTYVVDATMCGNAARFINHSCEVMSVWPQPLFLNEAKCEAIDMKMSYYSHANKTHFHKKGFALSVVLKSNCYSRVINVDGQKKIIIFASRSISRGEELTYDYKFPIEDEKLPCLCKSKHCRKYLN